MAGKLVSLLETHRNCEVSITETPGKAGGYGKICCVNCGNHRGPKFLKWLNIEELQLVGHYTNEEQIQAAQKRKKRLLRQNQPRRVKWSQATEKERNFYRSYQPRNTLGLPRTPTQLINDRLALTTHSRYNGNPIYSIPHQYLQSLLDTNKITRREDRQLIQAAIELQTGSYSTPLDNTDSTKHESHHEPRHFDVSSVGLDPEQGIKNTV